MTAVSKYEFSGLPSYSRAQVRLWNWYRRAVPDGGSWADWVHSAFQELLQTPARQETWLEQTHNLEPRPPQRHPVSKDEIQIGRSADNDVILGAPAIASHHARILHQQDAYFAEDFGSKLGTFIDRRRLEQGEQHRLGDGEKIVIFPYTLEFRTSRSWVPEGNSKLASPQASTTVWGSFRENRPAGRAVFPVHVEPSGRHACLEVEKTFLEELVRRAMYPVDAQYATGVLPDEIAECVLLSVLNKASSTLAFPLRLCLGRRGEIPQWKEDQWGVAIHFLLSITGTAGAFRIFIPSDLLECMAGSAPEAGNDWEPELSWRFPIVLGQVELSEGDLARVQPGDVVLFIEAASLMQPRSWDTGWKARLVKNGHWSLTIEETLEKTLTMDEQELGQLPILLQVVLGDKELTLAEIRTLGAGAIVELGRGKDEPVRLVANGKLVGEGELVEIEGKLGVRILNWKSS